MSKQFYAVPYRDIDQIRSSVRYTKEQIKETLIGRAVKVDLEDYSNAVCDVVRTNLFHSNPTLQLCPLSTNDVDVIEELLEKVRESYKGYGGCETMIKRIGCSMRYLKDTLNQEVVQAAIDELPVLTEYQTVEHQGPWYLDDVYAKTAPLRAATLPTPQAEALNSMIYGTTLEGTPVTESGETGTGTTPPVKPPVVTPSEPSTPVVTAIKYNIMYKNNEDRLIADWTNNNTPTGTGVHSSDFIIYGGPDLKGEAKKLKSITLEEGETKDVYIIGIQRSPTGSNNSPPGAKWVVGFHARVTRTNDIPVIAPISQNALGSSKTNNRSYNDLTYAMSTYPAGQPSYDWTGILDNPNTTTFRVNYSPGVKKLIGEWAADGTGIHTNEFVFYNKPDIKGLSKRMTQIDLEEGEVKTIYLIGLHTNESGHNVNVYDVGNKFEITQTNNVLKAVLRESKSVARKPRGDVYSHTYNDITRNAVNTSKYGTEYDLSGVIDLV